MKAFTLIELLIVIAIVALFSSLTMITVEKAYRHAKASIMQSQLRHSQRVGAFLDDNAHPATLMWVATNDQPYVFGIVNPDKP